MAQSHGGEQKRKRPRNSVRTHKGPIAASYDQKEGCRKGKRVKDYTGGRGGRGTAAGSVRRKSWGKRMDKNNSRKKRRWKKTDRNARRKPCNKKMQEKKAVKR